MKTLQLKTLIVSLTTFLVVGLGTPIFAGSNGLDDLDLNCEYTFAEDFMDYLETVNPVVEIQIYDQHQQLVIKGTADNKRIKNYISLSDLLTEVDNVQYYRLSYDKGIDFGYQFAGK